MNTQSHNSKKEDFAVETSNFNVREVVIGTYRNEKKDYLLPDTRQPHRGLELFLQTELNFELAESILDYTRYLNEIDKKKR